jgi:hypothetical protein
MKFRKLKASEIDCRVSTVTEKGCSILLYKDARVDQNLLDETVGNLNWQRSHQTIDGNLYCTVSVWDEEKKQWISKQDVGTESYTEKEKGQASDSFKRACFNLGIGRELYTAPFIWIPSGKVTIAEKNGKATTYDRFKVDDIGYDEDGTINRLIIRNIGTAFSKRNDIVYQLGEAVTDEQKNVQKYEEVSNAKINDAQLKSLIKTIENNPDKLGVDALKKKYKVKDLADLTNANLSQIIRYVNGGK